MLRFLLHIALLFLLVSCGDSIGPEAHTKPVELYELGRAGACMIVGL